jgi:hypothetical protein
MVRRLGLMAALLLAGAGPAWSQTAPVGEAQDPPATPLEDVTVDGRTLEERAAEFVAEVTQPVRRRGLARWARPACFGVVNFQGDAARAIADQLVARADELALPVGEADCEPNVFIIGTDDAPAVARAWVERDPDVFDPYFSGSTAGRGALETFISSDAAVRWWHISIPVHFDIFTQQAAPAVRLPGRDPPWFRVYAKSQHQSRIRDDLLKVLVLVDTGRMGPVTIPQLCDYLLMVAYARIDPEGDTAAYDTILNLFEDASVPGLTEWDRSYLAALYEADPTRRVGLGTTGDRLAEGIRQADPSPAE